MSLPFIVHDLRRSSEQLATLGREDLLEPQYHLATTIAVLELATRPQHPAVIEHVPARQSACFA